MEHALEFCTLAAESGSNKTALKAAFHLGFNPEVLTDLACRNDQATLNSLINMAIQLDNLIKNHHWYLPSPSFASPILDPPESKQIGCTHLSFIEREG